MNAANPGSGMDEYGDFPVNCPNGSGYSIRLGNNLPGTEAEGVAYDFTIPAGANIYNLIYHYAVVVQDPGHLPSEQPRLEIEILNLSDQKIIDCSSFTFFANGTILPGFELSPNPGGNTPVWFKRWTAVSINLDGLAGKNIRLFFKTADCTFRRHFGYAYVDVNSECSDRFTGAEFCPDDTSVIVTAPYGYQGYQWYDRNFTQTLGNAQTLSFTPPPATGSTVAVILTPYNGYGCLDTLYTDLTNTLNYTANAGPDLVSCNDELVQLGSPPKAGWTYSWSPATGLNNPYISNPLANPLFDTRYVLTVRHDGGGCLSTDTVNVKAANLDNTVLLTGSLSWCLGSGDSTVLTLAPADSIQWYKNGIAISGANQPRYSVTQSGNYHAVIFNAAGCRLSTTSYQVKIASIPAAIFDVNIANQCLSGNNFIFTNRSTNSVGNTTYQWLTGDGNNRNLRDLTYSYPQPGSYNVKLIVSSDNICSDTASIDISVYPSVPANFNAAAVCINLPMPLQNTTIEPPGTQVSYQWDFGNGQSSLLRDPLPLTFSNPGTYRIKLTATSEKCPLTPQSFQRFITVDKPAMPARYPLQYAVANLPLTLQARPVGNMARWSPPVSLNDASSYSPEFIDHSEREYTVTLTTLSGCVTVDTQLVKINKSIVIYVPNSFTPNGDGLNELLRPFMIGMKSLAYFKIFNRWGELVYQTSTFHAGWDGRLKGLPVQTQTFVWMLEGTGADNRKYNAKGSAVLIR
jgi:gliding motility-associated-like protein